MFNIISMEKSTTETISASCFSLCKLYFAPLMDAEGKLLSIKTSRLTFSFFFFFFDKMYMEIFRES